MSGISKGRYAGLVMEGTVVAYYPVGHPKNLSKIEDEYAVEIASATNQLPIANCRLAQPVGYNNGFEAPLRPASKRANNGPTPRGLAAVRPTLTDGDVVLVQFIDGLMERPIITHVVSHPSSKWRTKSDDFVGPFVRRRHLGTEVILDHNGNVVVKLDNDEDEGTVGSDKTVSLTADGDNLVNIAKDRIDLFEGSKAVARVDDTVAGGTFTATAAQAGAICTLVVSYTPAGGGTPAVLFNVAFTGTATVPVVGVPRNLSLRGVVDSGSPKLFTD